MAKELLIADGYKVIQSVEIAGMEIVVAENPDAKQPYLAWRRSLGEPFGTENHLFPVYKSNYLDALREFIQIQSACADNLSLERVYRGSAVVDAPLTAEDCRPDSMDLDFEGKVVAIKSDIFMPEYRACSHQLMLATGGFGCSPKARGRTVYGTNLYSGEQECWNRSDILGVVKEEALPSWSRDKISLLIEPPEKESVIEKIREAKAAAKAEPATPRKSTNKNKSEPEL